MRGCYLAMLVEDYCKENNLDLTEFYNRMAREYQQEYGVNIQLEAQEKGCWDICDYLEMQETVGRYVAILNRIKRGQLLNT